MIYHHENDIIANKSILYRCNNIAEGNFSYTLSSTMLDRKSLQDT